MTIPEFIVTALDVVSRGFLFLFASPAGLIGVAGILLLWLVISSVLEILQQQRLAQAAGSKLSFIECLFRGGLVFVEKAAGFVSVIPVLVLAVFIGLSVSTLTQSVFELQGFIKNARQIQELKTVLKHLDQQYPIARITVTHLNDDGMDLDIAFYDYYGNEVASRRVSLPGTEFFIDSIVCNFAYTEIEDGSKINLTIPYKIFSDVMAPETGINIFPVDQTGVPLVYTRNSEDIYGMEPDVFYERLQELSSLISNEDSARQAGVVRSTYSNAVHKRPDSAGEVFILWTLQSGGMSLVPFSFE